MLPATKQPRLYDYLYGDEYEGRYRPFLTAVVNAKGVLDVDTVKGCELGVKAHPNGGCYGECYAKKTADRYGIDFSVSVSRKITRTRYQDIFCAVRDHQSTWYRIGVAGDPCHDWDNTVDVCEKLAETHKTPVIITKHWIVMSDEHLIRFKNLGAVIHTSTSGMDSDYEISHRTNQIYRIQAAGIKSMCRLVTCNYGETAWGKECNEKQNLLLSKFDCIDNPFRAPMCNVHVLNGDIKLTHRPDSVGGGKYVSLHSDGIYIGMCGNCPDQCGANKTNKEGKGSKMTNIQTNLFRQSVEFLCVNQIIGSGYEEDIAKLAIEDGIAKRAARKNMQIHSAIVLEINGEFSGFMTFQNNHVCQEFCLLQSVIRPEHYDDDLYRKMVLEVLAQNTEKYPAIITTDPKSKFETPALFESLGFVTYLKMSGFHYMVNGPLAAVRHKLLAHITMTNVWNSIKGDWLNLKTAWNEKINAAGEKYSVANPLYASREGCWQGENGFSNIVNTKRSLDDEGNIKVSTKSHNGNASVLDPVACEVILRFFMPKEGRRIYNPFGGGVQFGFVAGDYGYEYIASEIRQNQCDANNKICSDYQTVQWVKSDSSTYDPDGMFDLIFTCPPYYRVERYIDYDGTPPDGEINSLPTYQEFRDTLFAGYTKAIEHLNQNCFFVVMMGDSRDNNGAFYGAEAETELFLKNSGLHIYNRIVYLETEFTRLAHAKVTLNTRKFPKREQKIIVAYKGKIKDIANYYSPVGRL